MSTEPGNLHPKVETDVEMADQRSDGGIKRKAEEEPSESNKKPRTGMLYLGGVVNCILNRNITLQPNKLTS
jgi:hypothetical protein